MICKIVDHYRKVGTPPGLLAAARHNAREGAYTEKGRPTEGKWAAILSHPELASHNEIHGHGKEVLKARKDRIEAASLARKPQKNAAAAIEVSISASPEWFAGKSPQEAKEYFAKARKWLADEFGEDQIIGWATHFDEKTPHMHVLLVPLTKTREVRVRKDGQDVSRTIEKDTQWAYSSSRFLGGPKGMERLHDSLAAALKPFGVERGQKGSEARHTNQVEWAAELAALGPTLEARNAELDRREAALAKRMADFEKRSAVKVKVFEPVVPKKPAGALLLEFDIGGGKHGSWEKHVIHEVTQQATAYGESMAEVAKAAQMKAARYEADAKRLPEVGEQLSEALTRCDRIESRYKRLTPTQLREEADKREAAIAKTLERDRDRGGQER